MHGALLLNPFSNLVLHALVAQLDRATDYESVGRAFESLQAHQLNQALTRLIVGAFFFVLCNG